MTITRIRWTEQATDTLRELWAANLSSAAIGRVVGRTEKAVRSHARRLDLPMRISGGPRKVSAPRAAVVVARNLPGVIAAPFARLEFTNAAEAPKPLLPLRTRILAQLATRPADSLQLSSACEAKELQVSQSLAALEREGMVVQSPSSGLRSRSWSLAMQEAA